MARHSWSNDPSTRAAERWCWVLLLICIAGAVVNIMSAALL